MATMPRAVPFRDMSRRPRVGRRLPASLRRRRFGRRRPFTAVSQPARPKAISDDVRLFASTFAAGFLFMAVLIG